MKLRAFVPLCLLAMTAVMAQSAVGPAIVRIDASREIGPVRRAGSGFLHPLPDPGDDWRYSPAQLDEFFWALQPRFVRTGSQNIPHYMKIMPDLPLVATLSDGWGYAKRGKPAKFPPYQDWPAWEAYVARTVKAAVDAGARHMIWDVWNEPNIAEWWGEWTAGKYAPGWEGATFENFCELYRRTYEVVHRVDPHAKMTGPSLAYMERPDDGYRWMIKFRDYVVAHHCVPDYWNWHFGGETIPRFAAEFTAWKLNEGCLIPEYCGPEQSKRPGRVAYEAILLEHSPVVGAMKANWARNDQFRGSINGLVIRDKQGGLHRRGLWWIFRTLAEMDGGAKVEAVVPTDKLNALAMRRGEAGLVLLGNSHAPSSRGTGSAAGLNAGFTGRVEVRLKLPAGLPAGRWRLEKIPYADYGAVDTLPAPAATGEFAAGAASVGIVIAWDDPNDAWRIVWSASAGDAR